VPEGTDIINYAADRRPGLIDMRAFVSEASANHRETTTASQAAATGGTTIIYQPDTSPVIGNSAAMDFVLRPRATRSSTSTRWRL
jgi:dihydroorotase